ncbi:MAG: hypothetical protein ACJ8F7_05705 [Gemmataceae bacterium]
MAEVPAFNLWLEFEHTDPPPGDDSTDDFANVQVRLPDGRAYALNVWTFKFLYRARFPWPYADTGGRPAEYVVAPDLFVERLDRPTLERVVRQLLADDKLKAEWLCPPNEITAEQSASADDGRDPRSS